MQCPACKRGELRPIHGNLACNRFPVCRHKQVLTLVQGPENDLVYSIFDFETTGTSSQDKIIEIGAVKVRNGVVVDEFEALINPGRYVTAVITEITGITNEMLMGKPTEDEVIPKFMDWLTDVQILGAHNLNFDARFLKATCLRLGIPNFSGDGVDTLAMARKALPGQKSHKLINVCETLGVDLTGAHRAIHDVRATQKVFQILKDDYQVFEPKPFGEFCKK